MDEEPSNKNDSINLSEFIFELLTTVLTAWLAIVLVLWNDFIIDSFKDYFYRYGFFYIKFFIFSFVFIIFISFIFKYYKKDLKNKVIAIIFTIILFFLLLIIWNGIGSKTYNKYLFCKNLENMSNLENINDLENEIDYLKKEREKIIEKSNISYEYINSIYNEKSPKLPYNSDENFPIFKYIDNSIKEKRAKIKKIEQQLSYCSGINFIEKLDNLKKSEKEKEDDKNLSEKIKEFNENLKENKIKKDSKNNETTDFSLNNAQKPIELVNIKIENSFNKSENIYPIEKEKIFLENSEKSR